ncbi:MAG: N-acetylmuramoyl-L-alanine amidase [Acidimicrobiales bacterium]|nr:N-acetylmuramoyl-L-alanine amidase [Acidimicrobiales bacterium]
MSMRHRHDLPSSPTSRRRFLVAGAVAGGSLLAPSLRLPPAGAEEPAPHQHGSDNDEPVFEELGGRPAELRPKAGLAPVPPPRIVRRSEWGADESLRNGEPSYAPVKKLVVHHAATPNNPADPAATVRSIQVYHVRDRGFQDIAYNFLIDQRGVVYEGRWARDYGAGETPTGQLADGRGVVGAHALNYNTGTCGICLLGDFTSTQPSQAALDALVAVLAWQCSLNQIDAVKSDTFTNYEGVTRTFPNIVGHLDLTPTGCPGDVLYRGIPTLRTRADGLLKGGLVGYWVLGQDGTPNPVAGAAPLGDLRNRRISARATAMAATPSGQGYWVVDHVGGVHAFGDARYVGSLPERGLSVLAPAIASTPSGQGYWLMDEIGGVHSFGDAGYFGSLPERQVRTRASALAPTPSGRGYWVLDQVGGVHSFGDAGYFGSLPERRVRAWGAGFASTPSGRGYWVLDDAGGVHSFGDAGFAGSAWGRIPSGSARGLLAEPGGGGYYVLVSDGRVLAFGSVADFGGTRVPVRAVALAGVRRTSTQ